MLTADRLRQVVSYCLETGVFRWKVKTGQRAVVGAVAGTVNRKGYVYIKIDGMKHAAHRLAWLYVKGDWPVDQIDHRNRARSDNRFANLRPATAGQNGANSIYRTGHMKGAYPQATAAGTIRWKSFICAAGERRYLGTFGTEQEAHVAYCLAAPTAHGEFAREA